VPRTLGATALTDAVVAWIYFEAAAGRTYVSIADDLGLSISTIARYGRKAFGYRKPPHRYGKRRGRLTDVLKPTT
jgi:hypothetical protein